LVALSFLFVPRAHALPEFLGDLDEDGQVTVLDLVRLINHLNQSPAISEPLLFFGDANQDGSVNALDVEALVDIILGRRPLAPFSFNTVRETSPAFGEADVSVNRETIFRFTQPLSTNTVLTSSNLFASFGGRSLLARIELSTDRKTVTLFYLEPLPSSARVRVTFTGDGLRDFLNRPLDLDGGRAPGGIRVVDFDTQNNTAIPSTAVIGHVFASDKVPGNDATNFVNRPLEHVLITVDGMEQTLRTFTDANGFFRLDPCPAGRFFVHIDGRTAVGSVWPNGAYYPVVGKAWEAVAGVTTNLAADTGLIYLPLITADTLQPVSPTNDTMVTFPPSVLAANPALAGTMIMVPANSLFSDNGARGGRVGIAPVPPDRLPSPLPPGLNFPLVITVQTDGPLNFDRPVPACFPNLPDPVTHQPLPPGTRNWLYSFNHDKGEWEAVGPMTVSEDGQHIWTDAGVGILQPGWHGSGPTPAGPPPPPGCTSWCCPGGTGDNQGYAKCMQDCRDRFLICLALAAATGPETLAFCIIDRILCGAMCRRDYCEAAPPGAFSPQGLQKQMQNPPIDPRLPLVSSIYQRIAALRYEYGFPDRPLPPEIQAQVDQLEQRLRGRTDHGTGPSVGAVHRPGAGSCYRGHHALRLCLRAGACVAVHPGHR
jgi:hypothetical protein